MALESTPKGVTIPFINNGNDENTPGQGNPTPPDGNFGGQYEPAPDVAGRIDRAIKRNHGKGRETLAEKIHREREALKWLRRRDPTIEIPFHQVSDVTESNEHNIRIAEDGRFWKYTKGGVYGFSPTESYPDLNDFSKVGIGIEPATPSEYLERLQLHNTLFGNKFQVEGISTNNGLVVSQRFIKGRAATPAEIRSGLGSAGWVEVPKAFQLVAPMLQDSIWYDPETRTLMIDARPANVLVDYSGKLFPIDVMLKEAGETLTSALIFIHILSD